MSRLEAEKASRGETMSVAAPAPRSGGEAAVWAALLVGTGIIAWSGVLARFLDVGPLAGAAWRMGLAAPALAVWSRWAARGRRQPQNAMRYAPQLILAGLAFAVDVGAFHISLTGTKVANSSFIGNVAPILAVVGGALFFRERPQPLVLPALALALFGSWVMAGMAAPQNIGYGDAFALLAAVAYASYLLLIKQARAGIDGPTSTLYAAVVSALVLALAAWLHGEVLIPHTPLGWIIVFLLGFVSHAAGQGLTSVAIGRAPVALVAIVILAQPPVTAFLAWLVLREAMTPIQMAGGGIILVAVLLARPR